MRERDMSEAAKACAKRPYSTPVLIFHGSIAELTRAGYGSIPENHGGSKRKRP